MPERGLSIRQIVDLSGRWAFDEATVPARHGSLPTREVPDEWRVTTGESRNWTEIVIHSADDAISEPSIRFALPDGAAVSTEVRR
jgi:hypothetical protein